MEENNEYFVLDEDQYRKLIDLRRVYGLKSLGDILCINQKLIELAFIRKDGMQVYGWNKQITEFIIHAIKRYWRPHMAVLQKGIKPDYS